jgi:hypothetical protein
MVAAIKWAGASTDRGVVINLDTTLATDTLSAAGSEVDNSTNLDTYGWLELGTSTGDLFGTIVARVGATADIYMIQAPDGTNYNNAPATADITEFGNLFVISIPIPTETGVVPQTVGPILLPPHKIKFYLYNNTDQTMQNTWELSLYTNNLETQ